MWKRLKDNQHIIEHNKWYNTCVMDELGNIRNEQELIFKDNLWWNRSGAYIYYAPTHYQ